MGKIVILTVPEKKNIFFQIFRDIYSQRLIIQI